MHSLLPRAGASLVAIAFLALPPAVSRAGSEPSPEPVAQRWGVPAFYNVDEPATQPSWGRRLTGYLEVRDGTRLRFSVLLPRGRGPFPVVINYSGYDPGAIGGSAYLHNDTAMSASLDRALLARGYAVLGVNARGTGCSEGGFDFLAQTYGRDGADVVEWAARQSWSTGAVGMANWSWAGMSQLATASERPAHLKAIAPGMALADARADSWAIGGVPEPGFIRGWWQYLHSRWLTVYRSAQAERDSACVAQLERNYAAAESPDHNLPTLLLRHPLRDEWINGRSLLAGIRNIAVPVLSMEAFQDEATTARASYYHDFLDPERLWLVQTNGNHDLYESLRFRATLLAFLDRYVKGIDNGFDRRPHVEVWQETDAAPADGHERDEAAAARWHVERARYPVAVEPWVWFLSPGHALSSAPAPGEPDAYAYPVEGPTVNVEPGHGGWGDLSDGWRKGSAWYTSPSLERDVVIYGPVSADLWISSSSIDTDIQVTLTEVRADGNELFVQRGWLRLSDRQVDETRSTAVRPILCDRPECARALVPDQPVLGRVELTKVSYAFRRGSRIRIWIDAPSATGELGFDRSSILSTDRVWHDAEHASRVVFGVLPGVEVPSPSAACGHVLMQPCRPDPLAQ